MKQWLLTLVAAVAIAGISDQASASQNLAQVVAIEVVPLGDGSTALVPCISINRGLYTAAQKGADFKLNVRVMYFSRGESIVESVLIPVRDTELVEDLGRNSLLVDYFAVFLSFPLDRDSGPIEMVIEEVVEPQ